MSFHPLGRFESYIHPWGKYTIRINRLNLNLSRTKKTEHGNGNRVWSVQYWNMDSKLYQNKVDEIQAFVDTEQPDLFFISEANLKEEMLDFPHLIDITGYNMTLPKTMSKYHHARLILLSKNNLNFTVIEDLMNDEVASIWVKPVFKGMTNMIIGGIYRHHNIIYQDIPNTHDSIQSQERRWRLFIQQWETASSRGCVMVIGDVNLDIKKWDQPDQHLQSMTDMVKDRIESLNFT